MQTRSGDITELLAGWREGDRAALDRLMPLIGAELHRLARGHLGRERKNTPCSLPLWCRRHSFGFCRAPIRAGGIGLIFSPSLHR